MRILWLGDLAATGFGTVTLDVGREFIRLGADIRFVSQNDTEYLPDEFMARTLGLTTFVMSKHGIEGVQGFIPSLLEGTASADLKLLNGEPWGAWKPDAVFLLGDFYGMREMVASAGIENFAKLPTFHYVPVEGHDLPPLWARLWKVIKPIAMSKFGQETIERITGELPPLVYHGVDAEAFHPVSMSNPVVLAEEITDAKRIVLTSKAACKYALLGRADINVALRIDRFMPRKGYDSLIRAMAPVMRERPNLWLFIHCRQRDFGGYLPDTISKYPDIAERIYNPQWGAAPREILLAAYNAADVYVSTSAEGFGLTIAEALACGVPAVGINYSAVPEVIGPAGRVVPVGRLLDNEYAHYWALPDEEAFGKAVSFLIDRPHRRLELGAQGPRHVQKNFRWDVAAERFLAIAQGAEERELVAA